ncbi:E3 ubiquitin-protein ligase RBBP6 [Thelohanellus kitauei]|uniref:E3 ubiquitin-protein ligase RBBP6 n=1 Tax=Thelohanellus kitauei TaxID=669202 RepID=A0A0C2MZC0_THEKT|nr:E3 ubiquitin-protein ligase RBBP6 [Thelohanellus kitauei]
MSSIHFKFRSGSEYEPLFFDGHCISLKDLRDSIIEKKRMGKSTEFKLEVTDSTTEKEYTNENEMIPKNASLIVRRVPLYYDKSFDVPIKEIELKRAEELAKASNIADSHVDEDLKLEAIKIQSSLVNEESEASFTATPGQKIAICYHCKQLGHVIKDCPIISKQISRGKEPVHVFLKNQLGLPLMVPVSKPQKIVENILPPDHLLCSLCKNVMNNAVLIACCGVSFCDRCIENYLIDNGFNCPLCQKTSMPDELIPNISLRKSVVEYEKSRFQNQGRGNIQASTKSEEPRADLPGDPIDSVPLTTVNNIPIVNNSLTSSLPLQQMAFATSALFMKSFLSKFNASQPRADHELVPVSAPFLTLKYATSVVSGERVLTREEFSSLRTALRNERKGNQSHLRKSSDEENQDHRRRRHRDSSDRSVDRSTSSKSSDEGSDRYSYRKRSYRDRSRRRSRSSDRSSRHRTRSYRYDDEDSRDYSRKRRDRSPYHRSDRRIRR